VEQVRFWLGFLLVGASIFLPGMGAIFLVLFMLGNDDPMFWAIAFPAAAVAAFAFAVWRWKRDASKHPLSDDEAANSFEAGMHAARIGCGMLKTTSRRP
jgi:hypothetical protein